MAWHAGAATSGSGWPSVSHLAEKRPSLPGSTVLTLARVVAVCPFWFWFFFKRLRHPVFLGGPPTRVRTRPDPAELPRSAGIARVQGGVAADSATALNVSFCYLLASMVSDDEFLLLLLSNCLFGVSTVRLCCISAWRSLSLWRFIAFLKIRPLAIVSSDSLCLFLSLSFSSGPFLLNVWCACRRLQVS